MRVIALFLPNWIGDVVMATPAILALRERFPDSTFIAVAKPYVAEVVANSPRLDRLVLFDRRGPKSQHFFAVVQELRQSGVEGAVLFPNSFRPALMAKLAGCSTIVGFARYGRDFLLTERLYPKRGPRGILQPVPVLDDYNRIVERLGANPKRQMELFTHSQDDQLADSFFLQKQFHHYSKVVGLNPGGAFGSSKHWPTDSFIQLARQLREAGHGVLVLCGPAEKATAEAIVSSVNRDGVVTAGELPLSIGLTKSLVRKLHCLVTTDSGPRHFAAPFGVPSVTLFGPTHQEWTITYAPQSVSLQKKLPCGPCQKRVCPLGHHRCMTELSPEEVFTAILPFLESRGVRHAG